MSCALNSQLLALLSLGLSLAFPRPAAGEEELPPALPPPQSESLPASPPRPTTTPLAPILDYFVDPSPAPESWDLRASPLVNRYKFAVVVMPPRRLELKIAALQLREHIRDRLRNTPLMVEDAFILDPVRGDESIRELGVRAGNAGAHRLLVARIDETWMDERPAVELCLVGTAGVMLHSWTSKELINSRPAGRTAASAASMETFLRDAWRLDYVYDLAFWRSRRMTFWFWKPQAVVFNARGEVIDDDVLADEKASPEVGQLHDGTGRVEVIASVVSVLSAASLPAALVAGLVAGAAVLGYSAVRLGSRARLRDYGFLEAGLVAAGVALCGGICCWPLSQFLSGLVGHFADQVRHAFLISAVEAHNSPLADRTGVNPDSVSTGYFPDDDG